MADIKYKYVYEDDIIIITRDADTSSTLNENERKSIKAKNGHKYRDRPHRFDTKLGKAFIYSNEPIPDLNLVGNNQIPIENLIRAEDITQ